MTVVVKFKPRHKPPVVSNDRMALEAVDQVLGAELVRLAEQYGAYVVVTVATKYVSQAIERTCLKKRATDDAWLRELAKCFHDAMTRKL
jgi:sugar phosphate isomerase/epimerase